MKSLLLSALADTGLGITVESAVQAQAQGRYTPSAPKTDHFQGDDGATHCAVSGVPFSLFNRRHHCRVSGLVCADAVCNYTQNVPSYGYHTPQRVSDGQIGLVGTDLSEDVLLLMPRKTELVALLRDAWAKTNNGRGGTHSSSSGQRELPMSFANSMRLSPGCPVPPAGFFASSLGLVASLVPCAVSFKELPKRVLPSAALPDATVTSDAGAGAFVVASPAGLGPEMVEQKQARALERQRAKDKKRKKADKERRKRAAVREAEREEARLERLARKREQKAKDRAAKKAAGAEAEAAAASRSAGANGKGGKARAFGGGGGGGGGSGKKEQTEEGEEEEQTELQRLLARRKGK